MVLIPLKIHELSRSGSTPSHPVPVLLQRNFRLDSGVNVARGRILFFSVDSRFPVFPVLIGSYTQLFSLCSFFGRSLILSYTMGSCSHQPSIQLFRGVHGERQASSWQKKKNADPRPSKRIQRIGKVASPH